MNKFLPFIVALILSVGLAAFQLAPALKDAAHLAPGNWHHPDCLSNHWLLIWVAEQISRGQGIAHNSLYYWPIGDMPVLAGNGSEGFVSIRWMFEANMKQNIIRFVFLITKSQISVEAMRRAALELVNVFTIDHRLLAGGAKLKKLSVFCRSTTGTGLYFVTYLHPKDCRDLPYQIASISAFNRFQVVKIV